MSDGLLETAVRLHQSGNLAEAGRLYSEILRSDPRHLEALYRLAHLHLQTGHFSEAEHLFAAAIKLNPQIAELFYGRGCALQGAQRYEDSLASFARALSLRPDYIEARNNRGVTLLKMKRYEDALAIFEALSTADPHGSALIFNNRAAALLGLRRYHEALDYAEKSLVLKPDQPDSLSTHGAILVALGRHEDAIGSYDRALRLRPDFPDVLNHRGSALQALKRLDEALMSYDRALVLKPDFADAFNNRGMVRLLIGRFRDGWVDHEWRWETESITTKRPAIHAPAWQGEDLKARRIAVYSEQGFGDVIQFVRYLPLLARRGAKVTFSVSENLVHLLTPLRSQIEIVGSIDSRERFDFQCALMSLPLWFGTELLSIPGEVPYLDAEEDLVTRWQTELGERGFKVGIAWQGAPGAAIDQGRSIPLTEFVPLTRLSGVRVISLQKTHGLDQLASLPAGTKIETLGDKFDAGPDAFVDTAAIMSTLDLIITSDTSIAHLAGALGRPTWVALKYVPDWRWLLDRDDSPWYPTLRLFRQQTAGDWKPVFERVQTELRALLDRKKAQANGPAATSVDLAQAFRRGVEFHKVGQSDKAERTYRQILAAEPNHSGALHLLGVIKYQQGLHKEAIEKIDAALEINPNIAAAHSNRGLALMAMKCPDEALVSFDKAIRLRPDSAEFFYNRGSALMELQRLDEALASFDKAIAFKPDYAEAFNNRGGVLVGLQRPHEALTSYDKAIAVGPTYAEAFNNRGNVLKALRQLDEARASYDRAVEVKPGYAEGLKNRGLLRLLCGDYAGGWADYECRWESKDAQHQRLKIPAPAWRGEEMAGKRIVIHGEQGLGDIIQFARYLPLLAQRNARITFLVRDRLIRLLKPLTAGIDVVKKLESHEAFDFQCALLSLAHWLGTDLTTIPNQVPYLCAEDDLVARWKARIGEHGFKVGIAWQGNPTKNIDRGRSIPLVEFAPLSGIPGVRLISLQTRPGLDQLPHLPGDVWVELLGDDLDNGPDSFIDTAAVMENLDLIITSDTSIAHLAGALGRPTWVALKYVPDWRWLLDREDSLWYPTLRLFRQETAGDWKSVFAKIEQELRSVTMR